MRNVRILFPAVAGACLLLGLLVCPVVLRSNKQQIDAVCRSRLGAIHSALDRYNAEHGYYPGDLQAMISDEYLDFASCICPYRNDIERYNRRIEYAYVAGLTEKDPQKWIIAFDFQGNHPDGSRSILYLSGERNTVDQLQFESEMERFVAEYQLRRGNDPVIKFATSGSLGPG
jgi:hypothetical protein